MNIRREILLYWLYNQFDNQTGSGNHKWNTFEHQGVYFPPEYEPHNIPLIYKGENVNLSPKAEEAAMLYAKYLDTEYISNKTFNRNFWNDWKKLLGKTSVIQSLEDCNFNNYKKYLIEQKELSKNKKIIDDTKYKTAILDGKEQPVGNFRIEPPGIFLGRGDNPKLGRIKRRIYPEDITLNIGKEAKIPEPLPGHKWGEIIHDKNVEWLASWKDDITGKTKYVWLGEQSDFKASSDMHKFEIARKLKKKIKIISQENMINLNNTSEKIKQIATALYFIDKLALRVGNEKGSDDTDTVGVTSLRIEHIKLDTDNHIILDFLGKDSVRYYNKVQVDPNIYRNLEEFMKNKKNEDQLFDLINTQDVNRYLQTFMNDLTAKVFRTYNASYLFQKEINKINKKYENNPNVAINILMDEYSHANAKVAKLCNHQKNITKSHKGQLDNIKKSISNIKTQLKKALESPNKNMQKIENIRKKLLIYKSKLDIKKELKNVSLGTSKANYIDPRITVAFMKLHNIPIDKVFSKALQSKFHWAFDVDETYIF